MKPTVSIGRLPEYQILILWGVYVLAEDGTARWLREEFSDAVERQTAVDFALAYAARHELQCAV